MIGIDFAIIGILFLSSLISLIRGFVKEAFSLGGWILAFWVSMSFAVSLSNLFGKTIEDPTGRLLVAFGTLFLLTLMVSSVINFFVTRLIQRTGLSGTDRFLGVIFGLFRGILVVTVLVFLAGMTNLPKEPWWNDSLLLFRFQAIAEWMSIYLPDNLTSKFHFS